MPNVGGPLVPCPSSLVGFDVKKKDACLEAFIEQRAWVDASSHRFPGPEAVNRTPCDIACTDVNTVSTNK